eukprot:1776943-Pyramimonas_sp.AAC.1
MCGEEHDTLDDFLDHAVEQHLPPPPVAILPRAPRVRLTATARPRAVRRERHADAQRRGRGGEERATAAPPHRGPAE